MGKTGYIGLGRRHRLRRKVVYKNSSDEFDIGHYPIKVKVEIFLHLPQYKNFTFTLDLFIDPLNVSDEFETVDLDLHSQNQTFLEIFNVCVDPCDCDNI